MHFPLRIPVGIYVFLLLTSSLQSQAQTDSIVVKGICDGQNLMIENPVLDEGKMFCIEKVIVNGKSIPFEQSSAFEINFSALKIGEGDSVTIIITHKKGCIPKALNNRMCGSGLYTRYVHLYVKNDSILTMSGSPYHEKFILQQFRWNRWIGMDSLFADKDPSVYHEFKVGKSLHSGKNYFRIKCRDKTGTYLTRTVSIKRPEEKDIFKLQYGPHYYRSHPVEFKHATNYELYDDYGNIILKGYGDHFSISTLLKGHYFLNYDDTYAEFFLD
jgi:hypothetical protein